MRKLLSLLPGLALGILAFAAQKYAEQPEQKSLLQALPYVALVLLGLGALSWVDAIWRRVPHLQVIWPGHTARKPKPDSVTITDLRWPPTIERPSLPEHLDMKRSCQTIVLDKFRWVNCVFTDCTIRWSLGPVEIINCTFVRAHLETERADVGAYLQLVDLIFGRKVGEFALDVAGRSVDLPAKLKPAHVPRPRSVDKK